MQTYNLNEINFEKLNLIIQSDTNTQELLDNYNNLEFSICNKIELLNGNICGFTPSKKYITEEELIKLQKVLEDLYNNSNKQFIKDEYKKYIEKINGLIKK